MVERIRGGVEATVRRLGLVAAFATLTMATGAPNATAAVQAPGVMGAAPAFASAFAAEFERWARSHTLAGATLAVSQRGRIVVTRGHGSRAPDSAVPVASLSKAITAGCAARLVQEGRLRFDTSLDTLLPEVRAAVKGGADPRLLGITVADLITHRAGFGARDQPDPSVAAIWKLARTRPLEAIAADEVLAHALRVPLGSAPGERHRYSNTGYLVLGAAIERATGEPYEPACVTRVLAPAGASGARLDPRWRVLGAFGGWRLAGPEYLAFLRIFEPGDDAVLGPAVKMPMLLAAPDSRADGGGRYGLGLYVRSAGTGGHVWSHTGSWVVRGRPGHAGPIRTSFAALVTRTDLGVSWFASCEPDPGPQARADLDAALWQVARTGAGAG
jgi:CubicO group peptidase (beta-lactamase class C family)